MLLSCGSGHLSVIAPKPDLRRALKFLRTYGFAVFTSKDRDLPMDIHFHPPAAINAKSTGIRSYSTTDCIGDLEFSHLTTVDSDFNDGHLTPHSNNLHSPSMDFGRHCESSQFTVINQIHDMDLSINIHLDPHEDFKDSSTTDYSTTDCAGDLEFSNLSTLDSNAGRSTSLSKMTTCQWKSTSIQLQMVDPHQLGTTPCLIELQICHLQNLLRINRSIPLLRI
ncbi:hypothetical protein OUZ56_012027 [Daphnia magna]|uniref:Uncharacterized protein n=1 Tax=Daphnia magna TaxID=35525 RepID=A0ABQ9Z1U1_9CRUS|nr:hypothetical protein OUZ56_012027 [Daphnia magna]